MLPTPPRKSYRKAWADDDVEPTGRCGSSPCPPSSLTLSRRDFLALGAALTALGLMGTRRHTPAAAAATSSVVIYRLSLRGRRGSNAAKKHNANKRFATQDAADTHRAHPGDRSRIVPITISAAEFQRLFPSSDITVADLRPTMPICTGDCNRNGQVTINELLTMVNSALGNTQVTACTAGDASRDGAITINEILRAVNNALGSCG